MNEEKKENVKETLSKTKIIRSNKYVFDASAILTMQKLNCLSASILVFTFTLHLGKSQAPRQGSLLIGCVFESWNTSTGMQCLDAMTLAERLKK